MYLLLNVDKYIVLKFSIATSKYTRSAIAVRILATEIVLLRIVTLLAYPKVSDAMWLVVY